MTTANSMAASNFTATPKPSVKSHGKSVESQGELDISLLQPHTKAKDLYGGQAGVLASCHKLEGTETTFSRNIQKSK